MFKGIDLREPENDAQRIANPVFEIGAIKDLLLENIENLRSKQKITQGIVGIDKSLNCDILMETGTGKTFCFLECVYALHKNYHLSKFIVLVPSNAIKLGVLLETLEGLGFGEKTDDENFKLTLNQNEFLKKEPELENLKNEKYLDFEKLKDFLKDRLVGNPRVRNKNERKTEKIKINKENFKKFETLWAGLNHQVRIAYAIDSESLIDEIVKNINSSFNVSSKIVSVTTHKKVETMGNNATTEIFERESACVWSLHEFISALSNKVKLSFKSVAKVLENIDENKFNEIKKNEQEGLRRLEDLFLEIIYQNIKDKISYQMRETTIKNRKNDAFYDEKGEIREFLDGSLGADKYEIKNSSAQEKCLYENFMQVDSEIEKGTIEESNDTKIIVFGKLPRVEIPVGLNQTYSPDFGYVVENNDKKVLLVVETKGVEHENELREEEKRKISTAKKFFEALKKQGVNIEYKTKLSKDQLSALINEVLNRKD
ncbi:restriction endonuclease [Helicobacter pylori]|uniref:restriction endonuclease n=1 Tax=Helicobacter pylori TaxID=210 RepID=UPI003F5C9A17